jgi:3-deoxy-D-manno-octulosonic-acid transferase
MSLARAAYSALARALLPVALARLLWRGRREPGYREHIGERLGRYDDETTPEPLIWLHAVSVGETRAAEPLVRALGARCPTHRILLTHMTPTGRRTGESLFRDGVLRAYLPYDYPGAVRRFLDHYRPRLGILLETEVWPNLVHACAARGVPLFLANARLSEKSLHGYLRVPGLARETFSRFSAIAAQTREDADRLRLLGARHVDVTGNLKFDVQPSGSQIELGESWRRGFGGRPVLLAASTREGEEALLLDAMARLPSEVLLVIVPRHPQRFGEVAALLENRNITHQRRSANQPISSATRVLLGDSMGEMFAYHACCDAAFIGGSLRPFGAQNLIEACAVGKAVLIGPSTYNFAEAAERAIAAGAALAVGDAQDLMSKAADLLADRGRLERMSRAGLEFTREHRGATGRVLKVIGVECGQLRCATPDREFTAERNSLPDRATDSPPLDRPR